jgi:hypothetical protein
MNQINSNLASNLDLIKEEEKVLETLPDFELGKKALQAFVKETGEEQPVYSDIAEELGAGAPTYPIFSGEVPDSLQSFTVLAEEIIKYAPIKTEQTKALKAPADALKD